eukprot:COSAG01_NODE_68138_length_265_cov_0.590361_1_plen_70_part_01
MTWPHSDSHLTAARVLPIQCFYVILAGAVEYRVAKGAPPSKGRGTAWVGSIPARCIGAEDATGAPDGGGG